MPSIDMWALRLVKAGRGWYGDMATCGSDELR